MKKLLKVSAWGLALAIIAALSAFLALKFYFTPERIKDLALEYAEKNLGREISLDEASLSLRGFSIKNLRVAETGGFKNGEFISAKDFSIRPDLKALLKKEFRINSISASGVAVRVLQVKKDAYNFSDLLAGSNTDSGKTRHPGLPAKPIELNVSAISVKDSSVMYANADRSMKLTLSGLDLKASSLTPAGSFPFEAAFTMSVNSSGLTGDFPVYAKGRAALGGWDPKKGRAEIEKATLKAGKIYCEIKGSLDNLVEPEAAISLRVKPFSTTELKPYFPAVVAHILLPALETDAAFKLTSSGMIIKKLDFRAGPALGSLKGRFAWDPILDYELSAEIKAQTPELDTTEIARKFHATPKNIKIPLADITARLLISPHKIRLLASGISAKSLKASVSGDLVITPEAKASGRLSLNAGDLRDLAAMVPQLRDYGLKGSAAGEIDFNMAKTLDLRGRILFNSLELQAFDTRLTEVKGGVDFSSDQLKADAVGKLDGSPLKITAAVKNYQTHPQVTLNADLAALKLKAVPAQQDSTPQPPAAGSKNAQAAANTFAFDISGRTRLGAIEHPNLAAKETLITYNLKNVSDDLSGLSGTAAFDIGGGKFDNLYELARNYKAAKVALYPMLMLGKASRLAKTLRLPDFNTITFTKMEGKYAFQNGVMKIQSSTLDADVANAETSGSINLVSESLDLKINTRLKQASGINLSAPLGMTVKGTFDNPSAKPDVRSIMEQPVIKSTVEKLLKGLLK
jgi:hypothetical protein